MTKSTIYLRLKKRRSVDIPALSRLVEVFRGRLGIERASDMHKQIFDIVTAMVGSNRVIDTGHRWWVMETLDPQLESLLAILSDLEAYYIHMEER